VKIGVFVLGMHRSGTSAVTRLVNLLGVPTCIDDDLLPVKPDNPRGHWESESLTLLNERLLDALGSDWTCPPRLDPGWQDDPALSDLRDEAAELFAAVCPSEQWVWKDPRNMILLPFWLRVLDVSPVAVLVHRNPLEIAASLATRDGLGRIHSLALWERHLRSAVGAVAGMPAHVSRYRDLLDDPVAWSRDAAALLRDAGVSAGDVPEDEALAFVDRGLRHTESSDEDVGRPDGATAEQVELFLALKRTLGSHQAFPTLDLGPESPTTEALLAERRHAYGAERRYLELESYAQQLAERNVVLERPAEFVASGHFYSAIPDFDELEARAAEIFGGDPLDVPGVDLRLDDQLALLDELEPLLADVPFDDRPRDGLRYHYRNGVFEHADGLFLHLVLRWLRPARVIEVGSGFSSACILDTVDRLLPATRCVFVDPNRDVLDSVLVPGDRERIDVREQSVQSLPVAVFEELAAGDLLFVDSTHVSKAGSDVNHLYFRVLPALAAGTIVHVHDVFPGFEYPHEWLREGRVWSENYLLRAFLQFNDAFEIVLWPALLAEVRHTELSRFPKALENTGGSIYLRRRGG
jgi:predicted O-methyltransferase YrrM